MVKPPKPTMWHEVLELWNKKIDKSLASAQKQCLLVAAVVIPWSMREDWVAYMWRLNGSYPKEYKGYRVLFAEIKDPAVVFEDPSQ